MLGLLTSCQLACTGTDSSEEEAGESETTSGSSASSGAGDGSGSDPDTAPDGDSAGLEDTSNGSDSGGGVGSGSDATTTASSGDPGGAGGEPAAMGVLSTKTVSDLSQEEFTALCDEVDGVVEVHPHCGGRVTGPGFSYDSDTGAFTEHTCAGYNTCTGFSCVVPE